MTSKTPDKCGHDFVSLFVSIGSIHCRACGEKWKADPAVLMLTRRMIGEASKHSESIRKLESLISDRLRVICCEDCGHWFDENTEGVYLAGYQSNYCHGCLPRRLYACEDLDEQEFDATAGSLFSYFATRRGRDNPLWLYLERDWDKHGNTLLGRAYRTVCDVMPDVRVRLLERLAKTFPGGIPDRAPRRISPWDERQ